MSKEFFRVESFQVGTDSGVYESVVSELEKKPFFDSMLSVIFFGRSLVRVYGLNYLSIYLDNGRFIYFIPSGFTLVFNHLYSN